MISRKHGPLEGAPFVDDSIGGYISYVADGTTQQAGVSAGALQSGTLVLYDRAASCTTSAADNAGKIRRLVINTLGRPRFCQRGDTSAACTLCPAHNPGC
ncbi:hypothetical protein CCP4SC76_7430002 [Gammaproteobacteria bacterium]